MELIIEISNSSEIGHKLFVENKLIEKAIGCYDTDDILVKLNSVEIFSRWGES
jgi:hypothetical protein